MSFISIVYRNVGKGLPRNRSNVKTVASPKPPPPPPAYEWQMTKAGSLEQTAQPSGISADWKNVFSKWLSWSKPFPGSCSQAADLVSECSLQLVLSDSDSGLLAYLLLGESGQFQDLTEAVLSCLPSGLRSFPVMGNISGSEEVVMQQNMRKLSFM